MDLWKTVQLSLPSLPKDLYFPLWIPLMILQLLLLNQWLEKAANTSKNWGEWQGLHNILRATSVIKHQVLHWSGVNWQNTPTSITRYCIDLLTPNKYEQNTNTLRRQRHMYVNLFTISWWKFTIVAIKTYSLICLTSGKLDLSKHSDTEWVQQESRYILRMTSEISIVPPSSFTNLSSTDFFGWMDGLIKGGFQFVALDI